MTNEAKTTTPASETPKAKAPVKKRIGKKAPAKKKAATKKTPVKKAAPKKTAKPSGKVTTLGDLADAYPDHLRTIGKSEGTASSYRGDLRVACRHFGEGTKLTSLTERKVKGYFESDAVQKTRKGEPKNPITSAKLCRVFRLGLAWVAEEGHIAEAPIPADYLPRSKKAE